MLEGIKRIFFIGVGGSGMSGIAKILAEMGYQISGSDLKRSETVCKLETLGVRCFIGHDAKNIEGAQLVVVSTAVPQDNVELAAARQYGIPVVHRGEMLAALMKMHKGIAVSGTHGKTTTTSMVAKTLEQAGLEPAVIVGGMVSEFEGNSKLGAGEYMVAEADESDGSFLKIDPHIVIITNVEEDHLDHYGCRENIENAFCTFINKVPDNGTAIVCIDNPGVLHILKNYNGPLLTYSLQQKQADIYLENIVYDKDGSRGVVFYRGNKLGELELTIPGKHNLSNALSAVAVGVFLKLDFYKVKSGLSGFKSVMRRFQLKYCAGGVRIVDDYAHHPTELKATLQAARQTQAKRIIAVFQPHRYTRTKAFMPLFAKAFDVADLIIINDIYSAGEAEINGINAKMLAEEIAKQCNENVLYIADKSEIADYLAGYVREGDLVLTLGAGDIWQTGEQLAVILQNRNQG